MRHGHGVKIVALGLGHRKVNGSTMKHTMNSPPKQVLVIAAAFPPVGGSGVQRTVKFCKYLPSFGWQPTVWTVDEYDGLPSDTTLLHDLPPTVKVIRHPHINYVKRAKRSLQRIGGMGSVFSMVTAAMDWRLTRWHQRSAWPDELIAWAKSSVKPLLELLDKQPMDVIYSTFSPVSNHWLALELKHRTGLPWIADFRDLWTDDCSYSQSFRSFLRADTRLQQTFLEQADAVVAVSPGQTDILAGHVPLQRRKRTFTTITNGFDPDDFRLAIPDSSMGSEKNATFVLGHVGTLAGWRTMDTLLDGIAAFVDSIGGRRDRFEFRSAGILGSDVEKRIVSRGIPLTTKGYVPHFEAVASMRAADALLLYCGPGQNASTVINGKLFEYLASQTPILCVGDHDAEISKIVRSTNAGLVVHCESDSISLGLRKLYDAWETGQPMPGCAPERLDPFSRVTTTAQLALILDRLASQQRLDCNDQTDRGASMSAVNQDQPGKTDEAFETSDISQRQHQYAKEAARESFE